MNPLAFFSFTEFISKQARGRFISRGGGGGGGITGCTFWFTGRWVYNWEGRGWGLISVSSRKTCIIELKLHMSENIPCAK